MGRLERDGEVARLRGLARGISQRSILGLSPGLGSLTSQMHGSNYLSQLVQSRPAPPTPMAMARGSEENLHIKPLNLHPRCDHQPNPQRLP